MVCLPAIIVDGVVFIGQHEPVCPFQPLKFPSSKSAFTQDEVCEKEKKLESKSIMNRTFFMKIIIYLKCMNTNRFIAVLRVLIITNLLINYYIIL